MNIFEEQLLPMNVWGNRAKQKVSQWQAGAIDGRSTGFATLDQHLRLTGGELTLIAARTSMGKTSLAMQMVENVASRMQSDKDEGCVAVYSAEMSGVELTIRMASALSGVNSHRLRIGKASADDGEKMQAAIRRLSSLPVWIDDSSRPTTQRMLDSLSLLNEDNQVRLMMFDFVELGGDDGKSEELRLSSIYQHLKAIAKHLDIPVLALSQVNREVEKRKDRMPSLSDLRGSGMGEQVADKIVFIMRPEYYLERSEPIDVPDSDKKGVAYIQIAKNRNGPVGLLRMGFDKERSRFFDLKLDPFGKVIEGGK